MYEPYYLAARFHSRKEMKKQKSLQRIYSDDKGNIKKILRDNIVKQNFNKQYSYCTEKGKKIQETEVRENSLIISIATSEIERRTRERNNTWMMATETMKRSMRDNVA